MTDSTVAEKKALSRNLEYIKSFLHGMWLKISPSIRTHIWVICNLVISLFFSLLPVMISAAIKASKDNISISSVFEKIILTDTMFLYCSAFIAPFVILTISIMFKKRRGQYLMYPIALLGSFYVVILGALMYSGVVARNLFSLGDLPSNITYPTTADLSIILTTLLVWYYCMYKESYLPNEPSANYQGEQDSNFKKFDGVIK